MTLFRKGEVPEQEAISGYPAPYNLGRGQLFYRHITDAAGLTRIAAALERLEPGGRSSQLHWHSAEDELLYMLEGELTVIEGETETRIGPGEAAGWKAGVATGHTIRNDGAVPAVFIIVANRDPSDVCHYPGSDMRLEANRFFHLDGTPWDRVDPA